ncbi:unnamed protein product [Paramecium primaurelia]|uniref:Tetratricopeptide repeat protein n=1 Tax=Paramecium primaurelia TaxID=5886 RepID=A0A8S1QMG9_PARPR|nr:unnamed protein product [Paramecium primaurelia]
MYQKANSLIQLNKLQDAQQIYQEIISINPKHEISLQKLGDILLNQKFYLQAQQYYEKFISINLNNSIVQFGIGECLRQTYQYNHALQYYLKAIQLDSSNKEFFYYYDSQFQQKQDFKCKDHPEKPALFWCKSIDCNENRIFCLICQKQNKHIKHYNGDVFSIDKLNEFLIEKLKSSKGFISECELQMQSTIKSYNKLISGLQYKFCGLENKINQFEVYQKQQVLDSLIRQDEFMNYLKHNLEGIQQKFQKTIDDLFIKLELHLIQYQITDQQIKLNQNEYQKGISLNIKNEQNEANLNI